MNEFQFKPEIAALYGVNEAIFLHSLSFWVIKNWSNGANYHDGRYWSYDTYKDIAKRFPFWTARQVERIVSNCEAQGAILVGNYNKDKTDRTRWYTLAGEAESIYLTKTVSCISPNGEMVAPQGVDGNTPNGEMQDTKEVNGITQTVKCIEGTVTDPVSITPCKSPRGDGSAKRSRIAAEWKPERFERFWKYYSKNACGKDKEGARKAWNKLKPDDALIGTMANALSAQVASEEWQRGIGIPHAQTWLNRRRWEDEVEPEQTVEQGDPPRWGWGA